MSGLQLRLLGSFQFLREEKPVTGFRSEKERALLAYLAIEAFRPHAREALAGLLWSELPDDTALNNLRVTLHRLRQVLGDPSADHPLLEVLRDTIQLSQNGQLWMDVSAFRELISQSEQHHHENPATCSTCMARYTEAAALYRGEFLQGIYPIDSLPFSEWALLKREHLHRQALQAQYLLAGYHQRRGELDPALGYARRQLELEPWREEAHIQVMTTLALRGERSAALRQYERCREVLREELGIEPAEETRVLYERILAFRKRRRHNLPLQTTPFIGRETELNELSTYLENPDCRLLTIIGPGGIGKSRLAFQAAEAHAYAYLHGVTMIQLAGITSLADMLRAIADELDLQLRPAQDLETQLIDYLREKEMLLVLDNYEQFLGPGKTDGVRILADLLRNAHDLRILVTSRQRLNLKQEWVFVLQGLSFPEDTLDKEPDRFAAVQLFLSSAHRIDSGFIPFDGEDSSIVRICQLLQGVPLAIELAAAWTRVMAPREIALQVESDLDFLANSYPDLHERHRSLRATFEHSYNLLTTEEQRILARLSLFPVSFERIAAEQVVGANLTMLTSLCDRSLLEQNRSRNKDSQPRYRMHELIRQFCSEKLRQDRAEFKQTKNRYSRFYMKFLNDRNKMVMGGRDSDQAVQEVNGEVENVRLALDQAIIEGNLNELGHSLNILMFFYEIQGLFVEAERVFGKISLRMEELSLTANPDHEDYDFFVGRAFAYHGWYCMHLARFDQAIELYKKGMTLSLKSGDLEGYGLVLNAMGVISMSQKKYQQAKGYLEEALSVCKKQEYTWGQAGVLSNLGLLAIDEGNLSFGESLIRQSLELDAQLNDEWGMAGAFEALGDIALLQGHFELAEKRIRHSLKIRQKLDQRWRVALSLNRLGDLAYRRQQYTEARAKYEESLAILRDFGERIHLTSTLARLGDVCEILGDDALAREAFYSSLKLSQETGAHGTTFKALLGIAGFLAKDGDSEQSLEILATFLDHPSLGQEDKEKAEYLLSELQHVLPLQAVQSALEHGKSKALEDIVKAVLSSELGV
jgi:predicted ATPase/two-component SAPR family response regulator